jgi:hypothetical protein
MQREVRDPQVELVRRYARILRSAPAEALRAQTAPTPARTAELVEPSRFGRRAGAALRSTTARSTPTT